MQCVCRQANAHHFGALACESCKGFFRRNAVRVKTSASDSAGSPSVSFEASCSTDVSGLILTIKPVNFQHPPHEQLPSDPSLYWQLSPEDRSLLGHLSSLYQETVLAVVKEALAQKVADVKELSYKDFLHDIDSQPSQCNKICQEGRGLC
ncbi:hypothetical protein C0Q70_10286 [Pomacea canaliculata]|uniref:Nuclear receptor domain-containing protein n=1 Tax=Pomacea canaliculata TaxID=400727 RepID=A0A2T7PC70_POMCA|nr:hypothetical protein C0Q70_10286 [Pomacea canaliculata]